MLGVNALEQGGASRRASVRLDNRRRSVRMSASMHFSSPPVPSSTSTLSSNNNDNTPPPMPTFGRTRAATAPFERALDDHSVEDSDDANVGSNSDMSRSAITSHVSATDGDEQRHRVFSIGSKVQVEDNRTETPLLLEGTVLASNGNGTLSVNLSDANSSWVEVGRTITHAPHACPCAAPPGHASSRTILALVGRSIDLSPADQWATYRYVSR